MQRTRPWALAWFVTLAGCSDPGAAPLDAAMANDAAVSTDASTDAGHVDAASADAASAHDTSMAIDAPVTTDAGPTTPTFPGRPAASHVFWGAAIGSNGDPAVHETPSGHVLALRRTYFQWSARTSGMITMARGDLAAGRLPWVSTKTPSWAEMAAGDHDADLDAMLMALDALDGPVWLTMHHEPEGGGGSNLPDDPAGAAGHVAMNRHVRERMTALGVDNVALAPILMSWTWDHRSGRNPDDWYAPGIYDFIGIDHYSESESTLVNAVWHDVRAWCTTRALGVAVGEWGLRGTDAMAGTLVHDWYDAAATSATDGIGTPIFGLAAFDSDLNSTTGGWTLMGAQRTAFEALMGDPRTAHIP